MMVWIPIALALMSGMLYAAVQAVLEVMNQELELARKTSMVPPRNSYAP